MPTLFKAAREAMQAGEVPVAAAVVDCSTNKVIALAVNRVERDCDPTAHAEILALRAAAAQHQSPRLPQCDLYVTLEPCTLCAAAISFARIRRLYFSAYDPKGGGVDHGARFYQQRTCHHKPDVFGGLDEQESAQLLRQFFAARRKDQSDAQW